MLKIKPAVFAATVTVATLIPVASAGAGLGNNHNETLLLDA